MTCQKQSSPHNSPLVFSIAATGLLSLGLLAQQSARPDDLDQLLDRLQKAHYDAATSLISEKDPRSIDPLIADLRDDNPVVRRLAAMVLGEMKATRVVGRLNNQVNLDIVSRAVDPLIDILADRDWTVRIFAAKALGQIGDRRAIPPLLARLNEPDIREKGACALALGALRASEAVDPLLSLLNRQSSWMVRDDVVIALGDIGDERATEPLINLLKGLGAFLPPSKRSDAYSSYELARRSSVYALAKIKDPRAVEPLIDVLNDPPSPLDIAGSATYALGELGDARAVVPLARILRDPKDHREAVAGIALGTIGGPAIPVLIKAAKNKEPNVRQNAVFGLRVNRTPEAIETVARAFQDPNQDVRDEAFKAILRINPPIIRKIMIAALKNPHGDIRADAGQWLANHPQHRN